MSDPPTPVPLSETELEILRQVATGATNREIGRTRHISEATVKKHISNINLKLGTGNRTEAVRRALEMGLVVVETPADQEARSEDARDREADAAETRRLAEELERARRRHRRIVRGLSAAALLLLVLTAAATYVAARRPAAEPTPRATPAVAAETAAFWVPAGRLPSPRSGHALAELGNTVFAIGGQDARGVLSETLRYEQGLVFQWRAETPKPSAVRDIQAVVVEERIVVPGGCTESGQATAAVEVYDPAARTWSQAAPLPEPVCGYGLAAVEGRIYLFGGRRSADPASTTDAVWTYRLGDPAWEPAADVDRLPQPRADLSAVVVNAPKATVHLLGGRDARGELWPDHWLYRPFDPAKWDTSGGRPLPEGRAGMVAAGIERPGGASPRRWLYVLGGGWDSPVEPASLVLSLDGDAGWQPFVELGGPTAGLTPQRGAALVTRFAGGQLFLAGGQTSGGELIDRTSILNLTQPGLLPPD